MVNFALFRYQFVNTGERNLFSMEGESLDGPQLNLRLDESLRRALSHPAKSLNLYEVRKNEQKEEVPVVYNNTVVHSEGGVTLLQVRNTKHKNYIPLDSDDVHRVGHYPYSWIVVDTRNQVLLVQKTSEAFRNPQSLAALVTDWIGRDLDLGTLGWTVVRELRCCRNDVWSVVRTRTAHGTDRLKSLSIRFHGRRENGTGFTNQLMQQWLEVTHATEGEIFLYGNDEMQDFFVHEHADLVNVVNQMIENEFHVKVDFEKSGSYEHGKSAEAVYGMPEGYIVNFGKQYALSDTGEESLSYDLVLWLDQILAEDDNSTYQPQPPAGRGRRRRNERNAS